MIFIGIPVHDERRTIGPLLWRIRELLYGERREFHVIVCDDASADGTGASLSKYTRVLPMTVLHNEECLGYAASLERIVREAVDRSGYPKRDALVTMQADFTDPPEAVPEMMRRFEGGADLVCVDAHASSTRGQRIARLGAGLVARSLRVPDDSIDPYASQRLYRLFTLTRAIGDLPTGPPLIGQKGWAANAELLLRVWPHIRRHETLEAPGSPDRRVRESRFRPGAQLQALVRAGRDPGIRAAVRRAREKAVA